MAETAQQYTRLRDVESRKHQLLKEIRSDSGKISKLKEQLTKKGGSEGKKGSHFSLATVLSIGAGVLDVAAVAWRVYGKFKK